MAFNQAQVGIQNATDGGIITARAGRQGDQIVSELHARYYEQVFRGNVFSVQTQGAGVTTTAALATTWTGLAVGNPVGSGVNLVLLKFLCNQVAVGVAGSIGIMGGVGTITGTLAAQSRLIGSGTVSKATASAGQTISTPVLITTCGTLGSLATTGYGVQPGVQIEIAGAIIVPPGSFIASYTSAATTTALQFGYVWEEVPV